MIVSLCVVAYNEEKVLNKLLEDIKSQDYDHTKMEIVLIDNRKKILKRFRSWIIQVKNRLPDGMSQ